MKIKTPAKLNLGLWIDTPREDGYHPLATLFLPVGLYDELDIELTDIGEIEFSTDDQKIPNDETNLCYKAAKAFCDLTEYTGGIKISLKKNIPFGAGLGGGSSDAAAVLKACFALQSTLRCKANLTGFAPKLSGTAQNQSSASLNHADMASKDAGSLPDHFGTAQDIKSIALRLGADVPFFLQNSPCIAHGIGEILEPVEFPFNSTALIVLPDFGISTPEAFRLLDLVRLPNSPQPDYKDFLLKCGSLSDMKEIFINSFEAPLFPRYPELAEIKSLLLENSAEYASLSGSGSAVFGLFKTKEKAEIAASVFNDNYRVFTAEILHSF